MTLYQFNLLDEQEQIEAIWYKVYVHILGWFCNYW